MTNTGDRPSPCQRCSQRISCTYGACDVSLCPIVRDKQRETAMICDKRPHLDIAVGVTGGENRHCTYPGPYLHDFRGAVVEQF